MGKKKNIDINGKPLETITIGEVKKHKYGWIGMIFLFGLFCALIYFLPDITKYYDKYIKGKTEEPMNEIVDEPEVEETVDGLYRIKDDPKIEYEGLILDEFTYENDVLNYKITNNSGNEITLSNVYLKLYNSSNVVFKYIPLDMTYPINYTNSFSKELSSTLDGFDVDIVEEEDYPEVTLEQDESGISKYVCSSNNNTLEYTFENNKLIKVRNTIKYESSEEGYNDKFNYYQNEYNNNNLLTGINKNFTFYDDYFIYEILLDYTSGATSEEELFFSNGIGVNRIAFIVKTKDYICS